MKRVGGVGALLDILEQRSPLGVYSSVMVNGSLPYLTAKSIVTTSSAAFVELSVGHDAPA